MESVLFAFDEWLRSAIADGIIWNFTGLLDSAQDSVDEVAGQVSMSPATFSPGVFNMIQTISDNVILPVAGMVLTFIACIELIQMIIDKNNLHDLDTWMFFKWIFKTSVAILIVSNTFNIVMAVFDVTGTVITQSAGLVNQQMNVNAFDLDAFKDELMTIPEPAKLMGIWLQSFLLRIGIRILSLFVSLIVYGRMIEIYMMTSLAPIPLATMANHEQGQMGQNYLRSMFALGFQGFLMLICVGIYGVLIKNVANETDIVKAFFGMFGYLILLCISLFKTGSVAKSILSAH